MTQQGMATASRSPRFACPPQPALPSICQAKLRKSYAVGTNEVVRQLEDKPVGAADLETVVGLNGFDRNHSRSRAKRISGQL
jgi:hypothetical protein